MRLAAHVSQDREFRLISGRTVTIQQAAELLRKVKEGRMDNAKIF